MQSELDRYIDFLRDITAEQLPDDLMLPLLVEQARIAVRRGVALPPEQRFATGRKQGRHLLYEDESTGFVVVGMVWPKGADSAPHDHGTWGLAAVLEGALEITEYEPEPHDRGLSVSDTFVARPGDVAVVLPPDRDVHRIRNAHDGMSISLHVYGKGIETCEVVDAQTGASETVTPTYLTDCRESALA
ncbi:MAG: cysteine dioxygenase family protein [Planctomycetota bacterium]